MDKKDTNDLHSNAWSVTLSAFYLYQKDKSGSRGSGRATRSLVHQSPHIIIGA